MTPPMRLSEAGLRALRGVEELRLTCYDDGGGVLTIGYGRTKGVRRGDVCSVAEAESMLVEDSREHEDAVNEAVRVPLLQNQFDALVIFSFNVGKGGMASSTAIKMVNGAQHDRAALWLLPWNKQGSRRLNGLLARRAKEALIYAFGTYE